jgi:hypothetical protein
MGSKTRKAQCTTLYACDSIKEKCSQRLRSILSVLPCSILRIWRLWARTKNEYTMDDFSTLPIREPWPLERISTSRASAWLAGIELMPQGHRDLRHEAESTGITKRALWGRGRLIKEFSHFLVRIMALCGNFRIGLLTPFLISQIFGFWQLIVLKVQYFSKLMRCICLCGIVLMMHVIMTRLPICVSDCNGNQSRERICVTRCYLTTKIPSALLVAVVWLQHTRYPRFRRGTFHYGVTTSPNKRGRVGGRSFMWMHISIPMLPKCICYAVHAQKPHFNLSHKVWARPERTSSGLRNRLDPEWHEIGGAQNLFDHN